MTPFMVRIAELVDEGKPAAGPQLQASRPRSIVEGADRQITTRAVAEQLVSEANAVLSASGRAIELRDELIDGQLSFTMRFAGRSARVWTSFANGVSIGHLDGVGGARSHDVALDGPDQLEELILLLVSRAESAKPVDAG